MRGEVPDVFYEEGMVALPVDFRRCREPACSDGAATGVATSSASGEPVAAFVHVVDCRPAALAASEEAGYDCSGAAEGNVYVQYFFYYPTSSTAHAIPGNSGFHLDDWESWQIRIEPDGTASVRASSHHGYNYEFSKLNAGSDAGGAIGSTVNDVIEAAGGRPARRLGPGHGRAPRLRRQPRRQRQARRLRAGPQHPGGRFELIPIESLSPNDLEAIFADGIRPPWRKPVYRDPESEET